MAVLVLEKEDIIKICEDWFTNKYPDVEMKDLEVIFDRDEDTFTMEIFTDV